MAYLTAVFRVRSRQPRLLLVNFEGSAMPWPGPGSQSPGAVTLGQRGDIFSPGAVGYDHGPDLPASSRRPNRCDPGIFEKRWHHSRRFLTREPSHIRLFLDTLPGTIAHHHSLLPSSRCLVSLARLTAPFPHSGVFSLTSDERCCRAPPIPHSVSATRPQVILLEDACVGSTPTSVSQTARWHWAPAFAQQSLTRGRARSSLTALPSPPHTQTRPKGIDKGGNARNWALL